MRHQRQTDDTDLLEVSIIGDEQEMHRIELEHNLRDFSLQLSASSSHSNLEEIQQEHNNDGARRKRFTDPDNSDVEFPRHAPRMRDTSIALGERSVAFNDPLTEEYDDIDYSRRFMEQDEDTFHPFTTDTISTAAHHASAVTLSAGLAGRGGKRRQEPSISFSGVEYDPERPVDSILQDLTYDMSILDIPGGRTAKRKVVNPGRKDNSMLHSAKLRLPPSEEKGDEFNAGSRSTPKSHRQKKSAMRSNIPKTDRMANGLDVDLLPKKYEGTRKQRNGAEGELEIEGIRHSTIKSKQPAPAQRKPFQDIANDSAIHGYSSRETRSKGVFPVAGGGHSAALDLPDITGLTNVVASPAKRMLNWNVYEEEEKEGADAHVLNTLTALQTRLNQLESENLTSKRRVRELEVELELCRTEVKKERTRVLEREEIIVAQQKDFQKKRNSVPATTIRRDADPTPYQEFLEKEKRSLENLVSTLRSHLSRLTSEIAVHRTSIDDLQALRDSDLKALRIKLKTVDQLRAEVERLTKDVYDLRGVVEEGLRRRKEAKDHSSMEQSLGDNTSHSFSTEARHEQNLENLQPEMEGDFSERQALPDVSNDSQSGPDKTLRTDRATAGSGRGCSGGSSRFINEDEIERLANDIEERRSERSRRSLRSSSSGSENSPDVERQQDTFEDSHPNHAVKVAVDGEIENSSRIRQYHDEESNVDRGSRVCLVDANHHEEEKSNSSFPQIRGRRMERLFFSAPAHDDKTCNVCNKQKHHRPSKRRSSDWSKKLGVESTSESRGDKIKLTSGHRVQANRHCDADLPPQAVLTRVLRDLEDDFTHYKGIYIELADQYKVLDAASDVKKRNVLAEHLKEVIDLLEHKGDQIASLYSLLKLNFEAAS